MARALVVCFIVVACSSSPRASAEDCAAILDRIVEIELREQGFRDPVLTEQKKKELRRLLAGELARCAGRRLAPDARQCIERASSSEEISHKCLR